jgi:hypothetical protein
LLVQDESIFIHDSMVKRRKWIIREREDPRLQLQDHEKTIVYGVLSLDGKQLFRQQDDKFDSQSFIDYLDQVKKKFNKFVIFIYHFIYVPKPSSVNSSSYLDQTFWF